MELEYELDYDWVQLIVEAKEMGMTVEEIREALNDLVK